MNMVFCKKCGLWIAETEHWDDDAPEYCDDCKPPPFIKRIINNFVGVIRLVFINHSKAF